MPEETKTGSLLLIKKDFFAQKKMGVQRYDQSTQLVENQIIVFLAFDSVIFCHVLTSSGIMWAYIDHIFAHTVKVL